MAIAKWKKIDIHTHTPASKCMSTREKDITPRDWIDAAKGKLDGVVVTDHNSIEWVEKLQNELNKEDNLFIYNGIELSVGDRGKHILIIFNTALSIDNINEILIEMGLTSDKRGRTDICIDHTKFISAVHEYRDSLLIIPAHFFSSKGLGNLANYSWISNYYQKIKFDAIEIRNENEITILKDKISGFNDPSFKEEIKELNNIATVIGSDNPYIENEGKHSINGIGDKYTWFKLSEFTLEGLRQAFLDPESRIKKVFEHNNDKDMNVYNHNYISGIKIKELKHLKGLDLRFSPNLNCIVGGRGTGKSTIVEMIKKIIYTNNNREYEGHHLLKSIKNDTEIDLFYNFGSFVENDHLLKYNVDGVNVVRKDLKTDEIIDVNEIEFPLDIYSQKEIYEMVDEEINPVKESKSKFLEIIDDNIELELIKIREQKDEQITKIKDSYSKVLAHKDLLLDMPKLVSEKASLESKLELIEDYDLVDIMDKKNILKSVDEAMDDFNKNYYDMFNELNRTLIEFDEKHNNKIMELEETLLIFDKNIDIIKYFKEYLAVATNLKNEVSDGLSKMDSIKGKYKEDEHFKNQKDLLDKEIKEIIDKLDIDQEQNSAKEISTLSDRLNTVNSKIEKLEEEK